MCCHQDVTRRQKSFFLPLPGSKYKPAAWRACPSLWFWNAGKPPPQKTCRWWLVLVGQAQPPDPAVTHTLRLSKESSQISIPLSKEFMVHGWELNS